jgi:hypothetical protein
MNPNPNLRPSPKFPLARILAPALICAGALLGSATFGADEPKPYTLFVGADILVGEGADLHPVRDIQGGSWVVLENGKLTTVTTFMGPISMKVTRQQKLTEVSATIDDLKGEKAYTFENDPAVKMTRALNQSAAVDAGSHAALNQATSDANGSMTAVSQMGGGPGGNLVAKVTGTNPAMQTNGYSQATQDASSQTGAEIFAKGAGGDDEGSFDALDVSFKVSATKQLGDPYVIAISRFHEAGAAADSYRELVFAKALAPIDAKPTEVKFEQAGFPPGFQLQTFEIHLYDNGEEVATNVAPKHVALTPDEAFQYVRTKYIEAHKGETLKAAPVMGDIPKDLSAKLAEGKYASAFYVKVSRDGLADTAFEDADCTKPIGDPYLDTVVRSLRFKPALNQGVPTDAVTSLNLSRFRI